MRQQEVFNKIGSIIRELNEQYEYMQTAGNLFNELELELMAANAHFLSDHVAILRKLSSVPEKEASAQPSPKERASENFSEPLSKEETVFKSPLHQDTGLGEALPPHGGDLEGAAAQSPIVFEFDTKRTNPNEVNFIYEMKPEEIIRHELVMDEEDIGDDWDEEDNNSETDLKPEPIDEIIEIPEPEITEPAVLIAKPTPEVFTPALDLSAPEPVPVLPEFKPVITEPQPIVPKPQVVLPKPVPIPQPTPVMHAPIPAAEEQVLTLNQRMSAQLANSKADHFAAPQPITDLKSAITLNDKLVFIKDLFHGYSLAYAEALDILNRMHTFEEAEKYLNNSYATKNNWADKQHTADKFYALLRRRYA